MNARLEILQASYWEHFKVAKDLARYLEVGHPKRVAIEAELNILTDKIKKLETSTKPTFQQRGDKIEK